MCRYNHVYRLNITQNTSFYMKDLISVDVCIYMEFETHVLLIYKDHCNIDIS